MKVDNSGSAVVFDEKTKEAIKIGQKRIEELTTEQSILAKGINSLRRETVRKEEYSRFLDDQIKEKESGIATLESSKEKVQSEIDTLVNILSEKNNLLTEVENKRAQIEENLKEREAAVTKREAELEQNILSVKSREESVLIKEQDILRKVELLNSIKDIWK